ncbi:hypothetical protein ACLOJK_001052 [Asimina triloba]
MTSSSIKLRGTSCFSRLAGALWRWRISLAQVLYERSGLAGVKLTLGSEPRFYSGPSSNIFGQLAISNLFLDDILESTVVLSEEELLLEGVEWAIVGEATRRGLLTLLVVSMMVKTSITMTARTLVATMLGGVITTLVRGAV